MSSEAKVPLVLVKSAADFPLVVKGRRGAYMSVIGVIVVTLAAGLAVPYVFGHAEQARPVNAASSPSASPGHASDGGEPASTEPGLESDGVTTSSVGPLGFGQAPGGAPVHPVHGSVASNAVAPGITGAEIRVGVPIFDLGTKIPVAGINPDEQRAQWNSYIGAVNKAAGAGGHQLRPVFQSYNPLVPDSFRSACLALTQDTQVFAVLGYGLFDNQVPCFAREHNVPVVNGIGVSDATMASSGARVLTVSIGKDRALRNHALELHDLGVLKGKKVGILTSTDRNDNAAVDAALVPTLRRLGVPIAHYSNLSSDQATALAQLPIESRQMQAAGVDVVFLDANLLYSGYFIQRSDQQGFHPLYTTSDFEQLVQDGVTNPFPQGFDGAIGVTVLRTGEQRLGQPEPAFDRRCREIYQAASGTKYQRGDLQYETTAGICSVVDITAKALAVAGPAPTRAAFMTAAESLKNFELGYSDRGTFAPGKHDAPQSIRLARWSFDCKCWKPTGPFHPARA
jgi:hypothetical protein